MRVFPGANFSSNYQKQGEKVGTNERGNTLE